MVVGVFASCTENKEEEAKIVTAIRAIKDIDKGTLVTKAALDEVQVSTADLPEGAIFEGGIPDIVGKYLVDDIVCGEYITTAKLSEEKVGSVSSSGSVGAEDYIVVTDHVKLGVDVSSALQELIDNNPNKTLYFPDGVYNLAKSITTPADPAKAVSFKCSDFAVFQPTSTYTPVENQGLIRLGAGAKAENATDSVNGECSFFFTGGVVNMNGKAGIAISVEGGRDILINNFAIRSADVGIYIATDHVDIDNGSMSGSGTDLYNVKTVTGVLVNGSYNTISNLRICSITVGIKLLKPDNVMRNLHPLYTTTNDPNSAGFWDESSGNRYDYCYSDNFSIGFHLAADNVSQLNSCFAFWYSASPNRHWGLRQIGQFNSVLRNCRFDMCHAENADNAYVVVEQEGGKGIIVDAKTNYGAIETKYQSMYNAYNKP